LLSKALIIISYVCTFLVSLGSQFACAYCEVDDCHSIYRSKETEVPL
jgi:hypothetical protein